ncbi:hypothetical protein AAHC03_012987 [Spirometra sp. Aus1]
MRTKSLPSVAGSQSAKNFQSPSERRLLELCTRTVQSCCNRLSEANATPDPDFVTRMRAMAVLNFDIDFQDGLVLACILSAFIPSLVPEFLSSVKLHPRTAAHRFHNAIQVVRMMQSIGIEFDLKPIDIVHPHPVNILLLLLHLFRILPEYAIRTIVEFAAPLHATASQHLTLSNPFSRPLIYKCSILGASWDQFALAEGGTSSKATAHNKAGSNYQAKVVGAGTSSPRRVEVVLPAKSSREITLEFRPRAIRASQAVLLVAGQRQGPKAGTTMVFQLSGRTIAVTAADRIHFEAECYEAQERNCPIRNPLHCGGLFEVKLIECEGDLSEAIMKLRGLESQPPPETDQESLKGRLSKGRLRAFTCFTSEVHLPDCASTSEVTAPTEGAEAVKLLFLPFSVRDYQACLLFSNPESGDFVVRLTGQGKLPKPMVLPLRWEAEREVAGTGTNGGELSPCSMRIAPNLAAGETRND